MFARLRQLPAGLGQLAQRLGQLAPGLDQLSVGLAQVLAGLDQLAGGVGKFRAGLAQLLAGAGQLREGLGQLRAGAGQLFAGFGQQPARLGQQAAGFRQLTAGIQQLLAGVGQLVEGFGEFPAGFDQLLAGAGQRRPGFGQQPVGSGQLVAGFRQLRRGVGQLDAGFGQRVTGFDQPVLGLGQLVAGFGQPPAGFGQLLAGAGQMLMDVAKAGFDRQPFAPFGVQSPGHRRQLRGRLGLVGGGFGQRLFGRVQPGRQIVALRLQMLDLRLAGRQLRLEIGQTQHQILFQLPAFGLDAAAFRQTGLQLRPGLRQLFFELGDAGLRRLILDGPLGRAFLKPLRGIVKTLLQHLASVAKFRQPRIQGVDLGDLFAQQALRLHQLFGPHPHRILAFRQPRAQIRDEGLVLAVQLGNGAVQLPDAADIAGHVLVPDLQVEMLGLKRAQRRLHLRQQPVGLALGRQRQALHLVELRAQPVEALHHLGLVRIGAKIGQRAVDRQRHPRGEIDRCKRVDFALMVAVLLGDEGIRLFGDLVDPAQTLQPEIPAEPFRLGRPVRHQARIIDEAAPQAAAEQFGIQHMAHPEQHAAPQRNPVAAFQRPRHVQRVAIRQDDAGFEPFLGQRVKDRLRQSADPRFLEHQTVAAALFRPQPAAQVAAIGRQDIFGHGLEIDMRPVGPGAADLRQEVLVERVQNEGLPMAGRVALVRADQLGGQGIARDVQQAAEHAGAGAVHAKHKQADRRRALGLALASCRRRACRRAACLHGPTRRGGFYRTCSVSDILWPKVFHALPLL
ncbi:hypothetical protein [Rhodobacter capsulatus]|uniref:hypothetical protein n=1 Tax=Rhodobacter capsulatus TaxID=1061 RepID=UPI0037422C0D